MADLIREANYLRFYHTSEDAMKDKDFLKNEAHIKYTNKVSTLLSIPLFAQLWQIGLVNNEAKTALYKQVRMFKTVTFGGALAFGTYELIRMRKQWQYYDRFYPEPTELQKTLYRDAMIAREDNLRVASVEERLAELENPSTKQVYAQMYQLPPQRYPDADDNPNAPDHKEHH